MITSPINYTGKKKGDLLNQILALFPSNIGTFVDMFGGSANVLCNVQANKYIYNDKLKQLTEMVQYLVENDFETVDSAIKKYSLPDEIKVKDEKATLHYEKVKKYYNSQNKSPEILYALHAHSFANMIRFNEDGEFNLSFGKRRYNKNMQKNLQEFKQVLSGKDIKFTSKDFRGVEMNKDYFYYFDSPYLISLASYNEKGGWLEQDDLDLFAYCDKLNEIGSKFALSNVFEHGKKKNEALVAWSEKYNVHYLNADYSNSNYQKKDKVSKSVEVLITNY